MFVQTKKYDGCRHNKLGSWCYFKSIREYEENKRLQALLCQLQDQEKNATEIAIQGARIVGHRIQTNSTGKPYAEYHLEIYTKNHGTLDVWHRYSTFRNLATTLRVKNGYHGQDIPELPNKKWFGNLSPSVIQERTVRLNAFLRAAVAAENLQWGIRVDDNTCAFKRRVRGAMPLGDASTPGHLYSCDNSERESLASTVAASEAPSPRSTSRSSMFASFT
ncbi:hypothetical protein As57867_003788, partial [Aphanomyces stellatus]